MLSKVLTMLLKLPGSNVAFMVNEMGIWPENPSLSKVEGSYQNSRREEIVILHKVHNDRIKRYNGTLHYTENIKV